MIEPGLRVQSHPSYLDFVSRCSGGWLVGDGLVRVFGVAATVGVRDAIAWNEGEWREVYGVSRGVLFWGENVFGDQFGVDLDGRLCVLRCEGGEFQGFVGGGFDDMIEAELGRLQGPPHASLLAEVRRSGLWPSPTQHIGFSVPLVVGGSCEVANVEIVEGDVHLSILAEIVSRIVRVADGTKISAFADHS